MPLATDSIEVRAEVSFCYLYNLLVFLLLFRYLYYCIYYIYLQLLSECKEHETFYCFPNSNSEICLMQFETIT